ncbi:MAG: aldo/keto reductase, partial [Ginsengibacter sp.]
VHFRVWPGSDNFRDSMEAMFAMQQEGKILHVGVSNVNVEELQQAMKMGAVATVENMYGHAQRVSVTGPHGDNRGGDELLHICEAHDIPLIPYFSLQTANAKKDTRIADKAKKYNATETQINIAWLLHYSPLILPIPGTSSLEHFKENIAAVDIELTEEDMAFLK